ncbi:YciI family protein [Sphingomonas sp. NCPPB 2930]
MRWIAIFDDDERMLPVRAAHAAAHLDYLDAHAPEILLGGGLRETPGAAFIGGLWVLDVASRERAVALVEGDPYFIHGARRYRLLVWGKAFPERRVVL